MPNRRPTSILWGLRFRNRCTRCGKIIPMDRTYCDVCSRILRRALRSRL